MATYFETLDKALDNFYTVNKGVEIDVRVTLTLELLFKNKGKHYSVRDVYDYLSRFDGNDDLTKPKVKYILEEMTWHGILSSCTKTEESILIDYHENLMQEVVDEAIKNEDGSITIKPYRWLDETIILYDAQITHGLEYLFSKNRPPRYYVTGKRKVNVERAYYYFAE